MRQWLKTCVDESKEMRDKGRQGKNSGPDRGIGRKVAKEIGKEVRD